MTVSVRLRDATRHPDVFAYVSDFRVAEPLAIASAYDALQNRPHCPDLDQQYRIIRTCQRVEVYSLVEKNPLAYLEIPFSKITGPLNVASRLAAIASGSQSQLLGETNITRQVAARLDVGHVPHIDDLVRLGIEVGDLIRRKHSLYARCTYSDLALQLLQSHSRDGAGGLVIVGSGMLARELLASQILSSYEHVIMLTRNVKRLRRKIQDNTKIEVLNHNEAASRISSISLFHLIVATNNIDHDYMTSIQTIAKHENCVGSFDLGALPMLDSKQSSCSNTYNLYSDCYLSIVAEENSSLLAAADAVEEELGCL